MKNKDIPLEYRKCSDANGDRYAACYSCDTAQSDNPYLMRVTIINPSTGKAATHADFASESHHAKRANNPHYEYHRDASLEGCYAYLPIAMSTLSVAFHHDSTHFHNAAADETIASRYLSVEADFFQIARKDAWHSPATCTDYQRRLRNILPQLERHKIGELYSPGLLTQVLADIAPHPDTCSADLKLRQIFSRFCGYLSARCQLPVCQEAMHGIARRSPPREEQIRQSLGIQRFLSISAIRTAFFNLARLNPDDPDWNSVVITCLGLICGPRTAECAALTFGSLRLQTGNFCVLPIMCQLVFQNGEWIRSDLLKTAAAYRELVLPQCLHDVLEVRRKWVAQRSNCIDVSDFPLFPEPENMHIPLTPAKINELLDSYLLQLGVSDSTIEAFRSLQQYEQMKEDRTESLCYYTLRRTCITLLHTLICLPDSFPADAAIAYMAGHARTRVQRGAIGSCKPPHNWQLAYRDCLDQFIGWLTHNPKHYCITRSNTVLSVLLAACFYSSRPGTLHIAITDTEPDTVIQLQLSDFQGNSLDSAIVHTSTSTQPMRGAYTKDKPLSLAPFASGMPPADPDTLFLADFLKNNPTVGGVSQTPNS